MRMTIILSCLESVISFQYDVSVTQNVVCSHGFFVFSRGGPFASIKILCTKLFVSPIYWFKIAGKLNIYKHYFVLY